MDSREAPMCRPFTGLPKRAGRSGIRGFSLIEVALAMAIVALMLGSALQMFTAMSISSETKDTIERLALM